MNRPKQNQLIVHLVRALTGLGLLVVAITIGLIGSTLNRIRTERALASTEQARLNRASDELRQRAVESRVELQAVLDENRPFSNRAHSVARLLDLMVEQSNQALPGVRPTSDQFTPLRPRLAEAARQAQEWRVSYDPVWQDISQQRTLGQVRALITQLRGAVEDIEGRRRLDDAIKHRRWRAATNDVSVQLARSILEEQGRAQSQGANDFKSKLAECARLVELLGGEEQIDSLADLKDNKLKPVLDYLSRNIVAFGTASTNGSALTPQFIERLKSTLLRTGPDGGGLFTLRHDALRLRREREKLKLEIASLFQDMEKANAGFAQSTQARTAALTQEMEASLAAGWQRMLYVGGVCSALFLWLAWMISRGIGGQVQAIDQARAEAEEGRKTTHKLMLEQQAAAEELTKAHKEMKASKQLQELIFNSVAEGIQWIDHEGKILFDNPKAARLLGWGPNELIGRPSHPTIHHTRADGTPYPRCECPIYAGLNDGQERHVDNEVFCRRDGTHFPVEYTSTPVRDGNGAIVGSVVVFSDITERKRAEAERARLVDFLEASLNEVYVFDTESLRFSYVNRSARQNLGYTAEQIAKLTPLDLKPEFTEETFRQTIGPLLAGTVPKHLFQTFHRRADGTDYPVEVCLQLVVTGTERVFLAVINDITERKRAETELTKAQKELVDVSRQAGMAEVATAVLHNVGNVLNSVNVSANLVSDQVRKSPVADLNRVVALLREQGANLGAFFTSDPRGPKVPDFLAQVADKFTREQEKQLAEVAALQKNIEHIKDIVAMQQSYAKVSGLTESLSPVELIEDALRMNSGSFQKHEVELLRELPADLPRVCVDKHKVLQILVNLLRNARHACDDSGRADKCITVRATQEKDRVLITIADSGVGIPPENLNRIFNHGFTTKQTGHGFGLHSAANAAKEMGGGLSVHSDGPGGGATFTLELPAETTRTAVAKQSLSHAA